VQAAYLFGSRALGRERTDSDTDVAVLLPRGTKADLRLVADLTLRLERAGVIAPDLHILNETALAFQWEATRVPAVYAADQAARAGYEAWLTLRYLDFEPLLAVQYRIQRRRIAEKGTLGRPRPRRPQARPA
jgi:predicted nucleotidyltransferase